MSDIRIASLRFAWSSALVLALTLVSGIALGAAGAKVGVPLDLVFSIDSSGSMGPMPPEEDPKNAEFYGKDVDRVRVAASKRVVRGLNRELVWVGLVSWDKGIDFTLPVSDDHDRLLQGLDKVDSRGGTDLDLGLRAALDLLVRSPRAGARKVVVFLTDGMSQDGISPATVRRAQREDVTVYTIGLEVPPAAREHLVAAAQATGGRYFAAPDAAALQDIFNTIIGQVTEVFLQLETPEAGRAGDALAVTARLVDRSGGAVVALEEIAVQVGVVQPEATIEELRRIEVDRREVLLPPGAGSAVGEVAVGERPGIVVVAGAVPALGIASRRMVPVAAAGADVSEGPGRFELVVEEPSVVVGRPLTIKAVHLDVNGRPAPTARDHDLVFTLTPRSLDELAPQQLAAVPIELPGLARSAFAQPSVRSLGIEPGDFVEVDSTVFRIRAVFRRDTVAFTFSVLALEPLLFEVALEADGEPVGREDLIGFAERFDWVERKEGGLLIWANPGEIEADGNSRASIRVLTAFSKEDGGDLVLTCLPAAEDGARELQLTASRGGTLRPPRVRPLSAGCNAIIEDEIGLRASHIPGLSVIEAVVHQAPAEVAGAGTPQRADLLFGHGSVIFLAVAPLLQLLAAAAGGVLGAGLREYQRLEDTAGGWITYRSLVGPFLVMGMVVGALFYGAVYYLSALLPWTPGIAIGVVAAAVLGGVAGYVGPRIMGVVRDVVYRWLGVRTRS